MIRIQTITYTPMQAAKIAFWERGHDVVWHEFLDEPGPTELEIRELRQALEKVRDRVLKSLNLHTLIHYP